MNDSQQSRKVLVEDSAAAATALVSQLFASIICEAVEARGVCHLALAGGTTPHGLYQQLAASLAGGEVPWGQVEVFFGDERDVSQDHVESNYHMAQKTLLDHVPVQPASVHPMPADSDDLAASAGQYEETIRRRVPCDGGEKPRFDLILLGMGGDGHTASLFPDTEVLQERKKLVTAYFVPVLGRRRMTFTFPLINAARNVILLITGEDKAEAVADLLGEHPAEKERLPAARVAPAGTFFVVLDAAAAKRTGLKPR